MSQEENTDTSKEFENRDVADDSKETSETPVEHSPEPETALKEEGKEESKPVQEEYRIPDSAYWYFPDPPQDEEEEELKNPPIKYAPLHPKRSRFFPTEVETDQETVTLESSEEYVDALEPEQFQHLRHVESLQASSSDSNATGSLSTTVEQTPEPSGTPMVKGFSKEETLVSETPKVPGKDLISEEEMQYLEEALSSNLSVGTQDLVHDSDDNPNEWITIPIRNTKTPEVPQLKKKKSATQKRNRNRRRKQKKDAETARFAEATREATASV